MIFLTSAWNDITMKIIYTTKTKSLSPNKNKWIWLWLILIKMKIKPNNKSPIIITNSLTLLLIMKIQLLMIKLITKQILYLSKAYKSNTKRAKKRKQKTKTYWKIFSMLSKNSSRVWRTSSKLEWNKGSTPSWRNSLIGIWKFTLSIIPSLGTFSPIKITKS